jgi:ferredoxin-NADP reductase
MQAQRLLTLAGSTPNLHVYFCYSNPNERDQRYCQGSEAKRTEAVGGRLPVPTVNHIAKRIHMDWIRDVLPGESARDTHQYFICGPGPMLQSVTKALAEWGVPDNHVHFEAFGPSTVKKSPKSTFAISTPSCVVSFSKSGKTADWTPDSGSLLDLAEEAGIEIDSGCRAGDCHSCKVAIKDGDVVYLNEPSPAPEAGTILACVAVPKTNVTLDA